MAWSGPYATLEEALEACAAPDPVCDAPACPDGASESYSHTLSGGTGDYAALNGGWTYTHVSDDEWAGALGSATATLDMATGNITYDVPGIPEVLVLHGDPIECCGATAITVRSEGGTGTPPTATDLEPDGGCECP